jgi:hypothetical protein
LTKESHPRKAEQEHADKMTRSGGAAVAATAATAATAVATVATATAGGGSSGGTWNAK